MTEKVSVATLANLIKITGVVQGVGFRPYVYKLSQQFGLKGWVINDAQGVTIHWEGEKEIIDLGLHELLQNLPPLARVTGMQVLEAHFVGYSCFYIKDSQSSQNKQVLISPDVATCDDCLRELADIKDRRYFFPFINCTNCGPRFTIIKDRPYDRDKTSMEAFEMCPECSKEYHNPLDRRFHAQPNCCPKCGPQLKLIDPTGIIIDVEPISLLKQGFILAVKGLGGFHLACDATNNEAVTRLRKGKKRDAKPFALMAKDLQIVKKYCHISMEEEKALVSPARPIVILKQKRQLPEAINKGLDTLGIMLPYTPLHYLLFDKELSLLVMTSANLTNDPMVWENSQAIEKLGCVADYYLLHNRDIVNPCDDSIGTVVNNNWQLVRRARGYVPLPLKSPVNITKSILAMGGDLKSSFALASGDSIFLSQHLGDLDNYLNQEQFMASFNRMKHLTGINPQCIVADLHPNYQSLRLARELALEAGLPVTQVQHHHAHLVSCMIDNGLNDQVLGVICDGTGYGTDGNIWGFEFLKGDYKEFKRLGHLEYVPLPGGDVSIARPQRMAFSFIWKLLGEEGLNKVKPFLTALSEEEKYILQRQLEININTAMVSSAGRLFDAASSLITGCTQVAYEGQAAVELEALARKSTKGLKNNFYPIELIKGTETFTLNLANMWLEFIHDLEKGTEFADMAMKFHLSLAAAIHQGVCQMANLTGLNKVVLSGGVFQNRLLTEMVFWKLKEDGFQVYQHGQVPANDGGIALGQIVIGNSLKK